MTRGNPSSAVTPTPAGTTDVVHGTLPSRSTRLPADGWILAGAGVWALLVLAVYFRHAWTLLSRAEGRWVWPEIGQTLRYTGLPHLHEAVVRAAGATGAAGACALAVLGLGILVARVFAPVAVSAAEWLLLRVAFGAGTLGCVLYALAGIGQYTPRTVVPLILALAGATCVFGVAAAFRARRVRLTLPAAGEWPWMAITIGAVLYAGFCALAPETEYDALWYHLDLPRRWLAAGHPVDDVNEYVSLYPLGWDLLFGAALALDGPIAAKLLHWLALPACALIAALLARTVDRRTSPWMAGAIFVTAPIVFWEATTAYVDLALTLYLGAAVYALLRADDTADPGWLIVAGLQLGFACATKHLGLVALAAIVPLLAWSRLRMQPGGEEWAGRARAAVQAVAVVTVLALLVPLPWYVRAWKASGNPVFPDMYRVFGAEPPERWDALTERGLQQFKDHFGRPRTAAHLLALPWDITIHAAQYGGTLGPLLLAGLPAMILAAARRRRASALLAASAIYCAVWASPLSSYQMRFLVPVWPPCAAALAVGIRLVLDRLHARAGRTGLLAILVLILVASLPPWTVFHEGDRRGWDGWLTHAVHEPPTAVVLGGISADDYLRAQVRTYGAWQWINAHAHVGQRVLTFFSGDQLYAERARVWSEAVVARDATWGATSGDRARVQAELRRLGISYVLAPADAWKTAEHARLDLLRPTVMGPTLEQVYSDRWAVVFAIAAAARTGPGQAGGAVDRANGR